MSMLDEVQLAKINACKYACRYLVENYGGASIVGVGTGSTVKLLVEECRDFFKGKVLVPSSMDTLLFLASSGLTNIREPYVVKSIDLYVDGADEVSSKLDLVKGRGGAFLREKSLAIRSRVRIYVVDYTKYTGVDYLHAKPIPIEVVPFSLSYVVSKLEELGYGKPSIRTGTGKDGPVISDNGNFIVDYVLERPVYNARSLHDSIKSIHGVVETGIFPSDQLVDYVIIGERDRVRILRREDA